MFHPGWRRQALAALGETFDLVVIGGGITGCGVLFDAAQRGLRVLLVERDDLASGTSSRSSKLIHGGLRYLKQGQLRVTRMSCRERDRMVALDPHLVKPLPFVLPVWRGSRPPAWQVDLGLSIYDRMTHEAARHRHLDGAELAALAPDLPHERIGRAFLYRDAWADDARLTLAVAATGFAYGGLVLTRAFAEEGVRDSAGRLAGLRLRDLETGAVHEVRARLIVNAAGTWVDAVRELLGLLESGGRRVRPSRGSHLIFAAERLPAGAALTIPSPDDGRPVFFIPHPEGVLVGTTDLYHDGPLDDPRPSQPEVDYLLRTVIAAFPGRGITVADIRGAFAGLRPIVAASAAGDPKDPTRASREEAIWEEQGLLTVAGGKLTTWRATAEEVVDRALALLPRERAAAAAPGATAGTPLAGLAPADLAARLQQSLGARQLSDEIAAALARRLGALAWTACELAGENGFAPLVDGADLTAAEVRTHLRFGAVTRLEDLLLRRTRAGMWQPLLARELLAPVAAQAAAELGWSAARRAQEEEAAAAALAAWSPQGVR
jgi:glycerol-3-phosphate dehydrogenase